MGTGMTRYHSFLLRIWHTGDSGRSHWRASLEDTRTRSVVGFTSYEALLQFLRQLDEASDSRSLKDSGNLKQQET
jgi:hypothetical protein